MSATTSSRPSKLPSSSPSSSIPPHETSHSLSFTEETATYELQRNLTTQEIYDKYIPMCPHIVDQWNKYKGNTEFEQYLHLANLGRAERNVWNLFLAMSKSRPKQEAVRWYDSQGQMEQTWTYGEMLEKVRRVSYWLSQVRHVQKAERVVLCFAPCLDFFVAFWACLSQGIIAVPVCPPDPMQPKSDATTKLLAIIATCEPSLLMTHNMYLTAIEAGKAWNSSSTTGNAETAQRLFDLHLETCEDWSDTAWRNYVFPTHINPSHGLSLAFLQFTSGSTSSPKAVMVPHISIVYNAINCTMTTRAQKNFDMYKNTIALSFLPTFHDMGLQGMHIAPIICGGTVAYFSPLDFLAEPLLWLRLMTKLVEEGRYVTTGGPPFALDLCARRVAESRAAAQAKDANESFDAKLNLSQVISIIIGAEPIRLSSLSNFTEQMAPYGFSANSLMPAYGLAENVLHAYSKRENTYPPSTIYVSVNSLKEGVVEELKEGEEGGKWLVSSGEECSQDPKIEPGLDYDGVLAIVDPETSVECKDGVIGEIWLWGRSNTAGYWNNIEATAATYNNKLKEALRPSIRAHLDKPWLRTGDLGTFVDGQLYVTGRMKDLIIVNGANIWPSDIEECVTAAHELIRPGSVAAVPISRNDTVPEGLVIILEVKERDPPPSSTNLSGKDQGKMKLSKQQIALAQSVFKQTARLPTVLRGPTIRGLARLSAWWCTSSSSTQTSSDITTPSPQLFAYPEEELASLERTVRSAVLSTFAVPIQEVVIVLPRSVLKTSSGKVRRGATADALLSGELDRTILRRSTQNKSKAPSALGPLNSKVSNPSSTKENLENEKKNKAAPKPSPPIVRVPTVLFDQAKKHNKEALTSQLSSLAIDESRQPLDIEQVKRRLAAILAEELHLGDSETVLALSQDFTFDEEQPLDEYGLDSLTAMRIAGRMSKEFELRVPLSPFMFLTDPTLIGMAQVICKLHQARPAVKSASAGLALQQEKQSTSVSTTAARPSCCTPSMYNTLSVPSQGSLSTTATLSRSAPLLSLQPTSDDRRVPGILGLGTALPGPGAPQVAIIEVMINGMQLDTKRAKLLRTIGATSNIERRYSVLKDIDAIYFGRTGLNNDEGIEARNAIYKQEAPILAQRAAEAALSDWGGDRKTITHVVAVSCTGVLIPGLEFQLMVGLGLSEIVQRVSIQFMGCFGALSGMKVAKAFAEADARNRVLMVCCELCSLHMQLDDRIDNLVGAALFADGAGAMVVGQPTHSEHSYFEMHENYSIIIPDTEQMMAWEQSASGMKIGLSKEIPSAIYSTIETFACQLLSKNQDAKDLPFSSFFWAIHPGGPLIISAICERLSIPADRVEDVWSVLRKYGNMSSATLVFVLDEMRKRDLHGAWVPSLAFGPGLNIEGALLRATDGEMQTLEGVRHEEDSNEKKENFSHRAVGSNHTGLL